MPAHPRHRLHREEALRRPSQRSRARSSTPPHREQRREALTPYAAVLRPSRSFMRLRSWATPILGTARDQRPGCAVAADTIFPSPLRVRLGNGKRSRATQGCRKEVATSFAFRSMHEKPCGLEAFPWTLRGARASGLENVHGRRANARLSGAHLRMRDRLGFRQLLSPIYRVFSVIK